MNLKSPRYGTIDKHVGETPLVALERFRLAQHIPFGTPLAYAGRLDPMASGKLLILIGDECKVQEKYHSLDKEYHVEVLLGVSSDSGDVLGLLSPCVQKLVKKSSRSIPMAEPLGIRRAEPGFFAGVVSASADSSFTRIPVAEPRGIRIPVTEVGVTNIFKKFVGPITLPYPHFSSKTVKGKPLHTWTLEKRLGEIEIPKKESAIHSLSFRGLRTLSQSEILATVRKKIETIPPVTDPKKALGADFRRDDVRASWNNFEKGGAQSYQILSFTCIASSGTYMRSLVETIAKELGTCGLAYSIHRTKIGKYLPIIRTLGFWIKRY